MNINRARKFHAEVSTHSLNDIMFFLLLFFLIVSTIANPNVIKLLAPKADTKEKPISKPPVLTVTSDKRFFLDQEQMSLEDLEKTLVQRAGMTADFAVVLHVPNDLYIQDLVDILQVATRNNIRMVLAADRK